MVVFLPLLPGLKLPVSFHNPVTKKTIPTMFLVALLVVIRHGRHSVMKLNILLAIENFKPKKVPQLEILE